MEGAASSAAVAVLVVGGPAAVGGCSKVLFAELGEGEQAADVDGATTETAGEAAEAETDLVETTTGEAAEVDEAAGADEEMEAALESKEGAVAKAVAVGPLPPPRSSEAPVGAKSLPSAVDR